MGRNPGSKATRQDFWIRWWLYCSIGFVIGHALFGLIGHGFTGQHQGRPTGMSALAHTVGLIGLGTVAIGCQRVAVKPWLEVTRTRLIASILAFVMAFQFGAYVFRPPFDYIFGWPVLGSAIWIRPSQFKGSKAMWAVAAICSFWLGLPILVMVFDPLIASGIWQLEQSSLVDHVLLWVVGGGTTGVIGGLASGWCLNKLLRASPDDGG